MKKLKICALIVVLGVSSAAIAGGSKQPPKIHEVSFVDMFLGYFSLSI